MTAEAVTVEIVPVGPLSLAAVFGLAFVSVKLCEYAIEVSSGIGEAGGLAELGCEDHPRKRASCCLRPNYQSDNGIGNRTVTEILIPIPRSMDVLYIASGKNRAVTARSTCSPSSKRWRTRISTGCSPLRRSRAWRVEQDGQQIIVRIVNPRDLFGFARTLQRSDYPGTSRATGRRCSGRNPRLAVSTMQTIGQRLEEAHTRIR